MHKLCNKHWDIQALRHTHTDTHGYYYITQIVGHTNSAVLIKWYIETVENTHTWEYRNSGTYRCWSMHTQSETGIQKPRQTKTLSLIDTM